MSLFSSFMHSVSSAGQTVQAKVSGFLSVVDGVVQSVESEITNLTNTFSNFIHGGLNELSSLDLSPSELNSLFKDQKTASTLYDPVQVPVLSDPDSSNFSTADPSVVTSIAPTQPNDIYNTPVGNEPPLAFNGVYPFVHANRTESGHIFEWDDTPGHERVFTYHRSGTYEEISETGRRVVKVVGNNYTVVCHDDHVHVEGTTNLHARGNINITCLNDVYIDVSGRTEINCNEELLMKAHSISLESSNGDINIYSARKFNVHSETDTNITAKGTFDTLSTHDSNIKSSAKVNIDATADMNIKSAAKINNESTGDFDVKAGGSFIASAGNRASIKGASVASIDGSSVKIQEGASLTAPGASSANSATDARKTGLGTVQDRDVGQIGFFDRVMLGADDDNSVAHTAVQAALSAGRVTQEEVDNNRTEAEQAAYNRRNATSNNASSGTAEPHSSDTSAPANVPARVLSIPELDGLTEASINPSLRLSQNYSLADFTTSGSLMFRHQLVAQNGLSKVDLAKNLAYLARNSVELIRHQFGSQMVFSSGFRPGSGSQHNKGQAVDIHYRGLDNDSQHMLEIAQWIKDNVPYDQLILEYNNGVWTHVSFDRNRLRRQCLTILQAPGHWSAPPGAHGTHSGSTVQGLHALR